MGSNLSLMRCKSCGQYTLEPKCPKCTGQAIKPHPPRFSPQDKYGVYRRKLKLMTLKEGVQ